ncbi:hypothetical protein ACQW02_27790 [Humitalea sp. 24SJ18S-53]|uniref:hypothetical protein n=1 Tax=Humitalea sp. 24SJ18S-53 TaxID=3422307 RepID=UPI003D673BE6
MTSKKTARTIVNHAAQQRTKQSTLRVAGLPNFDTAPVFTIREVSHYGRWSNSTTRRLIEAGELDIVRVVGSVRVKGDSLRAKLAGSSS